ncbi:MAG: helix-turn-helix transcriptional regulator [Prevotellaceae bacterium]|nr:helix-turn-helix transcriptional regulator [Prevotellaceae bacterium]
MKTVAETYGISPARADEIYTRLIEWLAENKRYRRPDCTAEAFSLHAGLHRSYISAAVRMGGGGSFSEMVGRLRVRDACRLLRAPRHAALSAEEIGIAAGFSSRQSFYNAFRKYTGRTPRAYREEGLSGRETATGAETSAAD